jgi:FAD/FMN-containing dehydrogenase/Fe-S oxidoreductase
MPTPGEISKSSLVSELRTALRGDVDDSTRRRAEYSSDASNYRVVPQVVVFPRNTDDIIATTEICRALRVPLTSRGGGTSTAGNAIGPGVVFDHSRYLHRILEISPEDRTATVEPGVVLDDLQRAVRPFGLRFGPDPSTHARCTIGGMLGNNACGAHSMAYGTTAENVHALSLLDGTARRIECGPGSAGIAGLEDFVAKRVAPVATEFGRFPRQVSGYSLEHLLAERGANLARALVGTEGSCGTILEANLTLSELPEATCTVVLGYADMATAAEAVSGLTPFLPLALEGIDARMIDVIRTHRSSASVPDLPRGAAWLFVEVGGENPAEALLAAHRLARAGDAIDHVVVPAGAAADRLWRIREDGAGLGSRTPSGSPAWPAWEDAAVPPSALGPYLRDFVDLLSEHDLDGLLYGHFGEGCIHVRIDLPLANKPSHLRPFLFDAARLVVSYGGSLSGEHGDGRARSELLPLMYSPEALSAMADFKKIFDPDGILNPGIVTAPRPVDADLRLPLALPLRLKSHNDSGSASGAGRRVGGYPFATDDGDFTAAVHRCVGIGKCRADTGDFMCPSFMATRDEKDSPRGRARVLQEMSNGTLISGGWTTSEVRESLDLCLSCKACSRDCPASVDMATYKSEVLHEAYRGRLRPASHYSLGWLPRWLRLASRVPLLANSVLRSTKLTALLQRVGGIDSRRAFPPLSPLPASPARLKKLLIGSNPDGERVVLWVDSFTRAFSPEVAVAAIALLTEAGFDVVVPDQPSCCGLTWISTGQLEGARRELAATVRALVGFARSGMNIVGLEPSCTAVLRSDLIELLDGQPDAQMVAAATRTLAETLAGPPDAPRDLSWLARRLEGTSILAQPHCHQHAVMGYDADLKVLLAAGAEVEILAGCCGLAGNFGMERGHYDVSIAVAEQSLLPALRRIPASTILLADGFSCRTQAEQLDGRHGLHLAEILH